MAQPLAAHSAPMRRVANGFGGGRVDVDQAGMSPREQALRALHELFDLDR